MGLQARCAESGFPRCLTPEKHAPRLGGPTGGGIFPGRFFAAAAAKILRRTRHHSRAGADPPGAPRRAASGYAGNKYMVTPTGRHMVTPTGRPAAPGPPPGAPLAGGRAGGPRGSRGAAGGKPRGRWRPRADRSGVGSEPGRFAGLLSPGMDGIRHVRTREPGARRATRLCVVCPHRWSGRPAARSPGPGLPLGCGGASPVGIATPAEIVPQRPAARLLDVAAGGGAEFRRRPSARHRPERVFALAMKGKRGDTMPGLRVGAAAFVTDGGPPDPRPVGFCGAPRLVPRGVR
jgi:hypothetical protein